MGGTPAAVEPATAPDPARGNAGSCQLEGVQDASIEGAFDSDRTLDLLGAPHLEIAGAVDGEGGVLGKQPSKGVCEQPLGETTAVQHQSGWTCDRAAAQLHLDLAPAGWRCAGCRSA